MSNSALSDDIRQRFDEMRHRLARLERSVSPNADSALPLPTVSTSAPHHLSAGRHGSFDADDQAERVVESLSVPASLHGAQETASVNTGSCPETADRFAAIQARLLRKLASMESAQRENRSASAQGPSASRDQLSPLQQGSDQLAEGRSPFSTTRTAPKSPSPYVDASYTEIVLPTDESVEDTEADTVTRGRSAYEPHTLSPDSPLPTDPTAGPCAGEDATFRQDGSQRALFPPERHRLQSKGAEPFSLAAERHRHHLTPTIRFSEDATRLVPVTTAELLFLVRLRGLIASETETGVDPRARTPCHRIYISALEEAQLLRWRAAVVRATPSVAGQRDGEEQPVRARPSTASARSVSSRATHRAHASAFAPCRRPLRASAPTASSLSKAKKTSYF